MIERIDRQRGDVPRGRFIRRAIENYLKGLDKKDEDREHYTSFDHCGFRENGWLGTADRLDRSSFSFSLTIVIITMAMAIITMISTRSIPYPLEPSLIRF
jgi:hypothetical protein